MIKTRDKTNPQMLSAMKNIVFSPRLKLYQGFRFAYECLLEAIARKDNKFIEAGCEYTLAQAFTNGSNVDAVKGD